MKVTLINPAQTDALAGKNRSPFHLPPHSLLTVASLIKGYDDTIEIEILDENHEKINFDRLNTEVAGFCLTTRFALRTYRIAERLRKREIKVLFGGIHATVESEEALQHCDALVKGEAENIINTVMDDLKANRLRSTPIYGNETPPSLEGQPLIDFSLVNLKKYHGVTISTMRGCPYDCEFCSVHAIYGRKIKTRALADVMAEIDRTSGYIFFTDDNIIANRGYARELFTALIPRKRKWNAQSDIGIAKDDELLALARASGCIGLFIGFESLNEKNIVEVNKKSNRVSEYKQLINKIHDNNIFIQGSFITGLDHDDLTVFDDLKKFIREAHLDALNLSMYAPYPGTVLTEKMRKANRLIGEKPWGKIQDFKIAYIPKNHSPEVFNQAYIDFYKETHSWPEIAKRVWHAPLSRKMFVLMINIATRKRLSILTQWDE